MDTVTTKGRSLVFARNRESARCTGRLVPRRGHSRSGLQASVRHALVCDTQALDHLLAEHLPALRAVLGSHPALLPLVSSCNLCVFQRIPHTCSKIIWNCATAGLARGRGKGRKPERHLGTGSRILGQAEACIPTSLQFHAYP